MKKTLKILSVVILFLLFLFVLFLLISVVYRYKPGNIEPLSAHYSNMKNKPNTDTLVLVSWNIGYAGLGSEMDFFYEEGVMVRPPEDYYNKYESGILRKINLLSEQVDFFMLQEVDTDSKRSYFNNQVEKLTQSQTDFSSVFSPNFSAWFVPVPPGEPMGRVESGMLVLAKHRVSEAFRYSFPPDESFPLSLFVPDRCFMMIRYPLFNKELVVLNIHNSAYDETGEAKQLQLNLIRKVMTEEFEMGNWVIAGGDWNQNPPGFDAKRINTGDTVKTIKPLINKNLFPVNWQWAYDPSTPTNRNVDIPYSRGKTLSTIIDYFLVSPNIEVLDVKTMDLLFEDSDHQPVEMVVVLKKSSGDTVETQ